GRRLRRRTRRDLTLSRRRRQRITADARRGGARGFANRVHAAASLSRFRSSGRRGFGWTCGGGSAHDRFGLRDGRPFGGFGRRHGRRSDRHGRQRRLTDRHVGAASGGRYATCREDTRENSWTHLLLL